MPDSPTIISVIFGYALFRLAWWWGKKYLNYMKQQREVDHTEKNNNENPTQEFIPVQNYGQRTWYGRGLRLYGGDPELITRVEKKLKEAAEDQDRQE